MQLDRSIRILNLDKNHRFTDLTAVAEFSLSLWVLSFSILFHVLSFLLLSAIGSPSFLPDSLPELQGELQQLWYCWLDLEMFLC